MQQCTWLSSVYFNTQRPNVWPSIFLSLVLSFPSHVCVDYRHVMDLSLSATVWSRYRNICSHSNKPPRNLPRELHLAVILVASGCLIHHLISWRFVLINRWQKSWSMATGSQVTKSATYAETRACIYLYFSSCLTHTHSYLYFHV